MSKRFGRNQKRKMQERIKELANDYDRKVLNIKSYTQSIVSESKEAEKHFKNLCSEMDVCRYGTIHITDQPVFARHEPPAKQVAIKQIKISFDALNIGRMIDVNIHNLDQVVTEVHGEFSRMITDKLYEKLTPVFNRN